MHSARLEIFYSHYGEITRFPEKPNRYSNRAKIIYKELSTFKTMWEKVFDDVRNKSGEELRCELISYLEEILKNYGEPADYYARENPEINDCIEKVNNLLTYLAVEQSKLEEVYGGIKVPKLDFNEFRRQLMRWGLLWYYGDGGKNSYSVLRNKIKSLLLLLELGAIRSVKEQPEASHYI